MANPQKQYYLFHNEIKLGRYDEESFLREKRDLLVSTLKQNLLKDSEGPQLVDWFNQGSYALGTGIKPTDGDYDIDVGVQLSCNISSCPVKIKQIVKDALQHTNRTVEIKRPCVTITYKKNGSKDYHVDLPIYALDNGALYLASGKEHSKQENKLWTLSNPTELIDTIKNKFEGEERKQFRRCVRYLKKWRNEDDNLQFFKSIAITSAVYEYLDTSDTENDNLALISVLENLTDQFINYAIDPSTASHYMRLVIYLPAHDGVDLLTKVTANQMKYLQNALEKLKKVLLEVQEEYDVKEACTKLNRVFGDKFPIPEITETSVEVIEAPYVTVGTSA